MATTATERCDAAASQMQAASQRLRELQALSPFERSDAQENEMVRLERRLSDMQAMLPDLAAAKRKERAAVDVVALAEAWEPLRIAKSEAYDTLVQLTRWIWDQVTTIEGIHQEQEALLASLPDDQVRAGLMNGFWIDSGTMKARMAGNMFPPQAWLDYFNNPVGYRIGSGADVAANDPGVSPIPPRLIEKITEGQVVAPRLHRIQE